MLNPYLLTIIASLSGLFVKVPLVEIDRLAPQGDRSLFISEAIQFYISEANKRALRDLIKEGAIVRADRDLALAQE